MRNGKALCFFVSLAFESDASLKQDALLLIALIQYSFNLWALIRSFKRIVSTCFKGNRDFNTHVNRLVRKELSNVGGLLQH